MRIGAKTVLGQECTISAFQHVSIGRECIVADRVMLIDFDHGVVEVERPIRAAGDLQARRARRPQRAGSATAPASCAASPIGDNASSARAPSSPRTSPPTPSSPACPARVIRMRDSAAHAALGASDLAAALGHERDVAYALGLGPGVRGRGRARSAAGPRAARPSSPAAANAAPRQRRTPPPNGIHEYGAGEPSRKRSGSNASGSGHTSPARCTGAIAGTTMVPRLEVVAGHPRRRGHHAGDVEHDRPDAQDLLDGRVQVGVVGARAGHDLGVADEALARPGQPGRAWSRGPRAAA